MTLGRWQFFAALAAATALCIGPADARAQGGTITGRVTAQVGGAPLAEARILVLSTTISATTNEAGQFTLRNVPAGTVQIQALRVGYRSEKQAVTLTAGGTASISFALETAVAQLDEVVTTATGQQRRAEIGNSIATLGDVASRVEQTQATNISTLMEGKTSGVQILPPNMTGGAPVVRIRGISSISLSNAPIWIVDGIRYDAGTSSLNGQTSFSMLNSLSTEEIEDIEIVKGPSAATLYGTAAANGVVLVTTKKGRAGTTKWSFTGERGLVQDATHYQTMYANFGHSPSNPTGPSIRCKISTMVTAGNPGGNCISDSLTSYNLMEDKDLTFVHDGPRSLYGMNVSGGTEQMRYFMSGDIDDETGPIKLPGMEIARLESEGTSVRKEWMYPEWARKVNFRGNLNAALSPKFDLSFNSGFARDDNRLPPSGSSLDALYYIGMQNYGYKGCPGGVKPCGLDKEPMAVDTVPLNEYFQFPVGDVVQRYRPQQVVRSTFSTNGNYRPFSWMVNDFTVGLDYISRNNAQLCRVGECAQTGTIRLGSVSSSTVDRRTISAKFASTATWAPFRSTEFKTTIGGDYTNAGEMEVDASGTVLPPGGSTVGQASTRNADATWTFADKTLGLYAQEVVGLNDRLFITGAVRSDQNSAFGTKFQHVYYPKISAAWVISDESFFPKLSFLDNLRLRSAYGASGVQPGRTTGLVTFSAGNQNIATRTAAGTSGSGADVPGLAASQPGNPDLKPERSAEWESGFEARFLRGKISFDYTYYDKRTHDALINVPLPPSTGASQLSPLINVGSTRNWGHEVQATAQLVDMRQFAMDVTVSASHESNEVLDLGIDPTTNASRIIGAGGATENRVGYPINSRWYYGYSYADANGDGVLQVSEVQVDTTLSYAGYVFPRDIFSIQPGIDLFGRQLHVAALFDYRGGFGVQDGGNNFQCGTNPFACRETEDPTAPLALQARNVAKVSGTTINGKRYTTIGGYFMNGQFWKFREFSVAYTVPNIVRHYIHAAPGSSLVFAARNLKTWTKYTGLDPEEFDSASSDTQSNFQSAPPPRYLTLRVNLKY